MCITSPQKSSTAHLHQSLLPQPLVLLLLLVMQKYL